jgi:dihydrofolate reductase
VRVRESATRHRAEYLVLACLIFKTVDDRGTENYNRATSCRGKVHPLLEMAGMRARRKIIVYIATSADGYIARPDGDVEWLNRRPRNVDYGMGAFYRTIDTILFGRKTYDWALAYWRKNGKKSGMFDTKVANYVFSRKPPKRAAPGVEFVSEPVKTFARRLRAKPGKHVWMMGGGGLIGSFLDAGEIDEFDIHVIPTFIGKGIPLLAPRHRDVALRLRSTTKYPDGVVRLRYEVRPKSSSAKRGTRK